MTPEEKQIAESEWERKYDDEYPVKVYIPGIGGGKNFIREDRIDYNQIAKLKIEEYRYSKRDMPLNVDNVLDDVVNWLDQGGE